MNFKFMLMLCLSGMAVVFIAQNVAIVEISFLFWRSSMSSAVLIFLSLMIGCVFGWFLHGHLLQRKLRGTKAEPAYLS